MNDGGCLSSDFSLDWQLHLRKQTMSRGRGDTDRAGSVGALGLH